jgi:hypothetical protein
MYTSVSLNPDPGILLNPDPGILLNPDPDPDQDFL